MPVADAELSALVPVAVALLCEPEDEPEWPVEAEDPVPVADAETPVAVATEAALLVAVKKFELIQLAWHEA